MRHQLLLPEPWAKPLAIYLDWLRGGGKPDTTLYLRGYQIRRWAVAADHGPLDATADDLSHYLGQHDWAPSTRRSMRSALRSWHFWALVTGRRTDNPAEGLTSERVPIGVPRPAGDLAVHAGMKNPDPRVRLMIQLAHLAGLRCIEISRVSTFDVIPDMVGYSLIVHGKGNKKRLVPLHPKLVLSMQELPDGYAFPGQIDGHLSAEHVSKMISRALPDGITAHMLRHRFAGDLYRTTKNDIRAVQGALGHASVATTEIYTPMDQDVMRAGIEALG